MSVLAQVKGRMLRTDAGRLRLAVLGVAAGLLIPVAVAHACSPSAYMNLDKARYLTAHTVRITGYQFDPAAATPVTLEWASGATIGQAPIAADGTWSLSFALPASMHPGEYLLLAKAQSADGQMIAGLPARAVITITVPAVPPAPKRQPRPVVKPTHRSRPAPTPHRTAQTGSHGSLVVVAPVRSQATPPPPAVGSARAAPLAVVHRAAAVRGHARNATRLRSRTAHPFKPDSLPADLWPARVRTVVPAQPALPWVVLGLAALGLLTLGGAGGAAVALRCRPRPPVDLAEVNPVGADPVAASPVQVALLEADLITAELAEAELAEAELAEVELAEADVAEPELVEVALIEADLADIDLAEEELQEIIAGVER